MTRFHESVPRPAESDPVAGAAGAPGDAPEVSTHRVGTAAKGFGWSTCNRCGCRQKGYVREIEDEFLVRCPHCGAYDWLPEPLKVSK